jgi:hypothetical protein
MGASMDRCHGDVNPNIDTRAPSLSKTKISDFSYEKIGLLPQRGTLGNYLSWHSLCVQADMPRATPLQVGKRVPWAAVFWPHDHPMLPTCALAWQAHRTLFQSVLERSVWIGLPGKRYIY